MAHEVYVGVVQDPNYTYSGADEQWRENIDLVLSLGTRAGPTAPFAMSSRAEQVDWATFILPVTYEQLLEHVRPKRQVDVTAWRPFMPGKSDEEIRDRMGFNNAAKVRDLPTDRDYVLVSVEGL